jgi:uncharacterized protein YndB with AHSA1/START domain
MLPITTIIDVNRPVEDVFAYVTNPTHFVEWQHGPRHRQTAGAAVRTPQGAKKCRRT